jgi:hypothetical protein
MIEKIEPKIGKKSVTYVIISRLLEPTRYERERKSVVGRHTTECTNDQWPLTHFLSSCTGGSVSKQIYAPVLNFKIEYFQLKSE